MQPDFMFVSAKPQGSISMNLGLALSRPCAGHFVANWDFVPSTLLLTETLCLVPCGQLSAKAAYNFLTVAIVWLSVASLATSLQVTSQSYKLQVVWFMSCKWVWDESIRCDV